MDQDRDLLVDRVIMKKQFALVGEVLLDELVDVELCNFPSSSTWLWLRLSIVSLVSYMAMFCLVTRTVGFI